VPVKFSSILIQCIYSDYILDYIHCIGKVLTLVSAYEILGPIAKMTSSRKRTSK